MAGPMPHVGPASFLPVWARALGRSPGPGGARGSAAAAPAPLPPVRSVLYIWVSTLYADDLDSIVLYCPLLNLSKP